MDTYPQSFIFLTLLIGIGLAIFNANNSFLFAVFGISAMNMTAAFKTRTVLGVYFNLVDAFIVIMLVALAFYLWRNRVSIYFPPFFVFLLITWFIGSLIGIWVLGFNYEVIRSARWALNFPLALLVAANFVKEEKVSLNLVNVLFAGAVAASLQHLIGFWFLVGNRDQIVFETIRNVGFLTSPISCFLVAATQGAKFSKPTNLPSFIWIFCIGLFVSSLLLNQTRSAWIATVIAPFILALLFKQIKGLSRIFMLLLPILLVIYMFSRLIPAFDPVAIISQRYQSSLDPVHQKLTIESRELAIQVETEAWLEGNLLFGRGFAYNSDRRWRLPFGITETEVAWSHVGYISYLAQLGLIGLLVYGIVVPFGSIKIGNQLFQLDGSEYEIKKIALIGLSCLVINVPLFAMSGSYLQPDMLVPGLLCGALLGVRSSSQKIIRFIRKRKRNERYASNHNRNAFI
ncbi:MAG: O-antigen ligase family protein [Ardenticatenaceae bacterium]|nr:O-antigen ligase family protein [Ardenticatenaceae bacterium]